MTQETKEEMLVCLQNKKKSLEADIAYNEKFLALHPQTSYLGVLCFKATIKRDKKLLKEIQEEIEKLYQ